MSPEQARGEVTDKRSDIWSFGVVLYEMLTGKAAFGGATLVDTIAEVLKSEIRFDGIPADAPPSIRRLLRKCLERDRRRRLHDIADARLELDALEEIAPAKVQARRGPSWLPWAVAGLAVVAGGAAAWWPRFAPVAEAFPVEFSLLPPEGADFLINGHQVSPDGRQILVRASSEQSSTTQLWLRSLEAPAYRLLAGTEDAGVWTTFAPDSRSILFRKQERLVRLNLINGLVSPVGQVEVYSRGWTENEQGVVLLGSNRAAVKRASLKNGEGPDVTVLKTAEGETGHGFPYFLPGGRHFLYSAFSQGRARVYVADLEGKEAPKRLFEIPVGATVFAARPNSGQGLILYRSGDTLLGVGFDVVKRVVTSEPVVVAGNLDRGASGSPPVWVSQPARVMIRKEAGGFREMLSLEVLDRKGKRLTTLAPAGDTPWGHVEFSPDDSRILGDRVTAGATDLWTIDLTRKVASRLTFDPGSEGPGHFSADGRKVFYYGVSSNHGMGIFAVAADGSGTLESLQRGAFHHLSASPDGKQLAFEIGGATTGMTEIALMSLNQPDKKMEIFAGGAFQNSWPQFSPNGKWIAYASTEGGSSEIYVQSNPRGSGKWQVSKSGGAMARWRRDGRELVISDGAGKFYSVEVREKGAALEFGAPVLIFETKVSRIASDRYFAMSSDAQRFVMHVPADNVPRPSGVSNVLKVSLDWMPLPKR